MKTFILIILTIVIVAYFVGLLLYMPRVDNHNTKHDTPTAQPEYGRKASPTMYRAERRKIKNTKGKAAVKEFLKTKKLQFSKK